MEAFFFSLESKKFVNWKSPGHNRIQIYIEIILLGYLLLPLQSYKTK